MLYLTLSAEYTGSCLKELNCGAVDCEDLDINLELCSELLKWNEEYKKIIPLEVAERRKWSDKIKELDCWGMALTTRLAKEIRGGAKVKYYSEGLLKYLEFR